MTSFFIQNFGCRVNQAEAFAWARELLNAGLAAADDWRDADVILVNSCTLTHRADRDVRKFIQKAGRESPRTRIVATGCTVERERAAIAAMPGVVAVVGNSAKAGLAGTVLTLLRQGLPPGHPGGSPRACGGDAEEGVVGREFRAGRSGVFGAARGNAVGPYDAEEGRIESGAESEASFRARALVKVQDGCDNRCTFCVIPSVRGRSVSVPAEDVAAAMADLSARGYREVVLAGIHLSSWGDDFTPRRSLLDLLRAIEEIPGLGRLRLSSLDPRRIDGAFIAHVAANPKICQHFHLSLQHASETILKKMGRAAAGRPPEGGRESTPESAGFSRLIEGGRARRLGVSELYARILSAIREKSPEAALGADIIVGFPEETDEDFAALEDFLKRSPLTYFHVFSYSPRSGTAAAGLPQVPEKVKKTRSQALRRLSREKNLRFRQSLLGRALEAVVIRRLPHFLGSTCEVLTGNYVKVAVPACPAPERELVRVRITRVAPLLTEGEITG